MGLTDHSILLQIFLLLSYKLSIPAYSLSYFGVVSQAPLVYHYYCYLDGAGESS